MSQIRGIRANGVLLGRAANCISLLCLAVLVYWLVILPPPLVPQKQRTIYRNGVYGVVSRGGYLWEIKEYPYMGFGKGYGTISVRLVNGCRIPD